MIRKSTLLILLVAILLGAGVFYYQKKHPASDTSSTASDVSKPLFPSVQSADIQSISVQHLPAAEPAIQIARSGDGWQITQPLNTPADSSAVQGIADGLASVGTTQWEPGTPDRLKAYGLDPGTLQVQFTLKNGATHKILLGNKDFSGNSVYALVDSNQAVSLVPDSLLTSADKTADDLRDHSVLHVDADQVAGVDLKNSSGDTVLKKSATGWSMTHPYAGNADADAVSALLSAVANGKMTAVASETPDNLGKYGLAAPSVTLTVTDDIGKSSTLIVGKQQDKDYFARDTSRPTVFRIDGDLYKKLAQGPSDLLDKTPLHVDESDINQIEITDTNGSMSASRSGTSENWLMQSPDAQKGKAASAWKIFSVISGLHADEVIEKPTPDELASLAHPAYQLTLTDNSGKKRTLKVSKESGDFVYGQSSDSPAVFKFKKASLNDLNITPADLAS